jgi:formylglycine-generating enzyme required for sulfatase activity
MKTKSKKIKTTLLIVCFFSSVLSFANNLQITNMTVPDANTVQFDISWENGWFIPNYNFDAVWVFVKAQECAGTYTWDHLDLNTSSASHSVTGGTGLIVEAASDGKGVFIRRNSIGGGTQTGSVTLSFAAPIEYFEVVNFQVFGIEMVWVPQGDFRVGDGTTNNGNHSTSSFGSWPSNNAPRLISSEAAIASSNLHNGSTGAGSHHPAIPAAFPKGWEGFYCMKYEISQQQYVAFLNTLSLVQQIQRTANPPSSASGTLALTTSANQNRNSIVIATPADGGPAVYNTDLNDDGTYGDGDNIACNYLSWMDLLAYLDWSALRPMTELEFEKAARGFEFPVLNEKSWGQITILQALSSSLIDEGTSSELSTAVGNGLCAFGAGESTDLGPLRTGFTATSITSREGAGASAWGIMDMSGNVWEQCVSVGSSYQGPGLIFNGLNGDGELNITGNHNTANWPLNTTNISIIVRGGNWEYNAQRAQTSDRFYSTSLAEHGRTRRTGGRGVRRP